MKAAFVALTVLAFVALKVNADLTVTCSEDQVDGVMEYHPNPCDCHSYYMCLGTEPVPMPCPKGLHWNRVKNQCDWPGKAKCKKEPEC